MGFRASHKQMYAVNQATGDFQDYRKARADITFAISRLSFLRLRAWTCRVSRLLQLYNNLPWGVAQGIEAKLLLKWPRL